MTETEKNELRVKVAELCGWKPLPKGFSQAMRDDCYMVEPITGHTVHPPNYPRDLNACAEFEKTLTPDDFTKYLSYLQKVTESEHRFEVENRFALVSATATQRCQAFVKTMEEKR